MSLSFFVGSDLFCAGITNDGEKYIAERYYVVAETTNGRRFKHSIQFDSTKIEYDFDDDEGGFYFPDLREEATAKVNVLLEKIEEHMKSGGCLDAECWYEIDPRYGSEHYQDLDVTGYFKEKEEF